MGACQSTYSPSLSIHCFKELSSEGCSGRQRVMRCGQQLHAPSGLDLPVATSSVPQEVSPQPGVRVPTFAAAPAAQADTLQ